MADDVNARIGISADTTQAVSAIRALQAQLEAFYSANKGAARGVSKDIQSMQTNLMQSINKTGAFRASMVDVTSATQAFTTALEKNKLSMGQTFRYAAGSIAPFGKKFRAEWELIGKVARERVKDLQTQYIKMGRDADGAMKALKIKPLLLDLDSFNTKAMMSAQRMQIFTKLIDHGSTQLLNFGKNTQWAGRQLMVGFTVPLTMLGTAAAKSFMDIEKEVIKLRRVYGDFSTTIQDTDKMVASIKGLATEFTKWGVAVKDTIGLASEAAAAGAQGAELVNQVTEATRLAVLGNIDQQKAYETTISVTNAFGIATEDLTKKIDFLNAVENQTVTSIDDLTTAIPKAAPVIQQLGGNVEDLAFFLTAMKEGGINASEGANALKSGLAALINPTGKAAEMLQGFGINIKNIVESNKGDVKGLVIDFAKALDTLDPLNRARAIEQLFGKFQFSRLSTLFKNVIEDGTQAQRVLELTNASTKQLAILSERELAKVQDSTVFKFQAASEKFQAAIAPVGEQFLKMVTPLLEFGTKLLEQFNKMDDGTKNFVLGTVAVLGVIGPAAVMAFGLVANGVAQLIKMFNFFAKRLAGVGKDTEILGMQTDYMSQQMIEATTAAAALGQKHTSLIQIYSSESKALQALATALERSAVAQQRFNAASGATGTKGTRAAKKMATGGIITGPGSGTSDSVPAMLSNGEAVIPAKNVKKFPGLVNSLISGNVPKFAEGGILGAFNENRKNRKNEASQMGRETVLLSKIAEMRRSGMSAIEVEAAILKDPQYKWLADMAPGDRSMIGNRVGFKGMLRLSDPDAQDRAISDSIKGTQSAQQRSTIAGMLGLPSGKEIVGNIKGKLSSVSDWYADIKEVISVFNGAIKSKLSSVLSSMSKAGSTAISWIANGGISGSINNVQKALGGERAYRLRGVVKAQREAALIMEIGKLRQSGMPVDEVRSTILNNPKYSWLAKMAPNDRSRIAGTLGFEGSLRTKEAGAVERQNTAAVKNVMNAKSWANKSTIFGDKFKGDGILDVLKRFIFKRRYANGVFSVPGPKGAGDVVPAMLSPGEAVIPANAAQKYAPLVKGMIAGNIPGFEEGTPGAGKGSMFYHNYNDVMESTHFGFAPRANYTPAQWMEEYTKNYNKFGKEFGWRPPKEMQAEMKKNMNGQKTVKGVTGATMPFSKAINQRYSNSPGASIAIGGAGGLMEAAKQTGAFSGTTAVDRFRKAGLDDKTIKSILKDIEKGIQSGLKASLEKGVLSLNEKEFGKVIQDAFVGATKERGAAAQRAVRSMLAVQGFEVANPQGGSRSGGNRYYGTAGTTAAAREAAQPKTASKALAEVEKLLGQRFGSPKETGFKITPDMAPEGMTAKEYKAQLKAQYSKLSKEKRIAFALEMEAAKDEQEKAKKLRALAAGTVGVEKAPKTAATRIDHGNGITQTGNRYFKDGKPIKAELAKALISEKAPAGSSEEVMQKRGKLGKIGLAAGAIAVGAGAMSGNQDMGAMIAEYLPFIVMSFLPQIFSGIGNMFKVGMPASILGRLGIWGMIGSLALAVVTMVVDGIRNNIKEQITKGIGTGEFVGGSADQLQALSETAGTVGATELARAEQAARVAGVEGQPVSAFGIDYLGTEAGKTLQDQVSQSVKSGFTNAQIGQVVGLQLAEAVAQNILTTEQANSVAIRLGEAVKSAGIGNQIMATVADIESRSSIGRVTSAISAGTSQNISLLKSSGPTGTEGFGAKLGFGVAAYAQNQRLLDVINSQYDSQVKQLEKQRDSAKTTAERLRLEEKISKIENERTTILDNQKKLNNQNTEAISQMIRDAGNVDDLAIEALSEKLKKMYEDAPEMAIFATDAMKKAFAGGNMELGFQIASGDLGAVEAQKIVELLSNNKGLGSTYKLLIQQEGDAAAIELMQTLVNAGAGDPTIDIVLKMAASGDIESITQASQILRDIGTGTNTELDLTSQGIQKVADSVSSLAESSKNLEDVDLKKSGFENVQTYLDSLGLDEQFKDITKEQQITYAIKVNAMMDLVGSDPVINQAYQNWLKENAGGSLYEYILEKLGGPASGGGATQSSATRVEGTFVESSGGGGTPRDKLAEKIEKKQKALDVIALKEDKINKKYDERAEALQKIADLNKDVADQQKAQLSIAEALATGDIAGAARAMQAYQQQAAQNAAAQQQQALEQARQNELDNVSFDGQTRNSLEQQLADLQMQMAVREYNNVGKSQGGGGGGGGYWKREPKPTSPPSGKDPRGKWVEGPNGSWEWEDYNGVSVTSTNVPVNVAKPESSKPSRPKTSTEEVWTGTEYVDQTSFMSGKNKFAIQKNAQGITVGATKNGEAISEAEYNSELAKLRGLEEGWVKTFNAVNNGATATATTLDTLAPSFMDSIEGIDAQTAANLMLAENQDDLAYALEQMGYKVEDGKVVIQTASGPLKVALGDVAKAMGQQGLLGAMNTMITKYGYATGKALDAAKVATGAMSADAFDRKYASGGLVKPMVYRGLGGVTPSFGTDSVPALLTPGEFVIKRSAVKEYGIDNLKAINNGGSPAASGSVYNYSVTVNAGSNASADDIARTVMTKIKQVENQRVKGNRY